MDKKEFATFTMALRTYYPKESILPNTEAMQLWYRELQDIPFPVAEATLRKWVSTEKWSPSIAEIREMAATIQHGEIPDWGEAWEKVLKAIRKHGMYNIGAAMESFDPLTRQAVERIGFRELCMSENISVDRANFRMVFETLYRREQTKQQLALPLRQTIAQIQMKNMEGGVLMIGGGDEKEARES